MSNDIANINAPVDTAIAGTAATIFQPRRLEPTDEIRRGNGAKPRNGTGAPRRETS